MRGGHWSGLLGTALILGVLLTAGARPGLTDSQAAKAADVEAEPAAAPLPEDVAEARGRAKLLHETLHGVLLVVHRDFFREEEKLPIPSQSLEDVFDEVARTQQVQLRWLAVDTDAMNGDHKAKSEFDKAAVKVLASGEESFESVTDDTYQYAGTIRLSASCLGCHLPSRSSNKDRAAGLVISMPLREPTR